MHQEKSQMMQIMTRLKEIKLKLRTTKGGSMTKKSLQVFYHSKLNKLIPRMGWDLITMKDAQHLLLSMLMMV